ncbi:hypothetical protein ACO0SA_002376 [Hanseniaspora valbyensis]
MESSSAPGQYKSAYKKYNRWNNNNNSSNNSGSSMPEASFDLGKNKRVTVRQFRNVNLIDIREYYKDSAGELRPGKKGISLTEEMFDSLLSNYRNIDDALKTRFQQNRNNAQNDINNNNSANGGEGTAGTLLIDNSGTVKNEGLNSENVAAGNKRKNGEGDDEKNNKKIKETPIAAKPAPPQQEQQKKVEELESSANLVIPTKPAAKQEEVDSDDDFANDLENELVN